MQRIIRNTLAILLLLTVPAYAGGAAGLMVAAGSSAAAGCVTADSYIGNKGGASNSDVAANSVRMFRATATCSGGCTTLKTGYIWARASGSGNAKVLVYNDTSDGGDTTAVTSTDTLVGASASIAENASGAFVSAAFASGAITCGNKYFVVIANSADQQWETSHVGTASMWYKSSTDYYTSPPGTIGASWTRAASAGPLKIYTDLQ